MREILNFLRPPEDADWKTVNRWRWNVCATLLCILVVGGVALKNVAWASDLDKKIADAIKPIAQEQQEQRILLDNVSKLLTEQLSATVAAQIRLNISKRCKTTDFTTREELAREKDRLQTQYRTYKGEYYREPGCAEL
jgi:hypothetical protein